MNRTTTVVVALIAAAGLSTMVYAVPEQRALAWFGGFGGSGGCGFGGCGGCGFGCGGGFFGGCGFGFGCGGCGDGCGGGFFVHKTIIQTIHQVNNCSSEDEDHKAYGNNNQDQNNNNNNNNNNKQVVCVNTATNTARHGFGGFGGFN
jgi:hypothetical protein